MIYPINLKPAPRVVAGDHRGAEITHVGVTDGSLDIYVKDTVIKGSVDLLPVPLRRILGLVIGRGRPGPFLITPEELAEDVTYDPDSAAPGRDKPEPQEVEYSHPKERKLKQQLGTEDPETDEAIEIPKHEKFPPSLPSKHPKEKALEQQTQGSVREAKGRNLYTPRERKALPVHTGPLTKKFMGEITHMLKKDEGSFAQSALNTPKYLATLTFTRKPEAQKAAKAAAAKGFPNAQVVVIFVTLPQGQKKKVYAISNTDKPMFKKGKLDLTPFHLRDVGGAMFAKKSDAVQFAKKKGWRVQDVTQAFNRFNEFYVVGQQIDAKTYRVLGPQGHVDLKFGRGMASMASMITAKMKYLGQCDRLRKKSTQNEANWQEMMKQKKPISMGTFKSKADYKAILDEDETLKDFVAGDPDAGFFQSVWGNKKCVFLRTAGFEFIWV